MKNQTVRQRIIFSFAAVVVVVAAMGCFAYYRLLAIEKEARSLETDSVAGMSYIARLHAVALEEHGLALATLLQQDSPAAEAKRAAAEAEREQAARNYETTVLDARDRQLFDSVKGAIGAYSRSEAAMLRASAAGKSQEARDLMATRMQPDFDKLLTTLEDEVINNRADADRSVAEIQAAVGIARTIIFGGFVLIGLISIFFALHLNRMTQGLATLVGQVQKSGIQVNTSVTEIAATAKQQQATASEIAATTTEIGATSKEILATSKDLVRTMGEVASVAEESAKLAGSGQVGVSRMGETMQQVMQAAGSINSRLTVLNEKAGNINQVVTTITKVADQTNLLSLNAAIEAEKAGEYGRGFAVVATEIRRLADQTAVATYDIEQMVKEIQSAVSAGVMGMDKFSEEVRRGMNDVQQVGTQLSQIIQHVKDLAPRIESVNEGMQAQATGAEQISEALSQLSEAAQETVDSLRQSGSAIDGLNDVSAGLRNGILQLNL